MVKRYEEWDILGELGEKLVAAASKFQELKLALVHREIQRMADDTQTEIAWTADKLTLFKAAWQKAHDAEEESFKFEGHDILVTYGRYLIEYLEYIFGEEAA
jgi:hypothetical protein